MHKGAGYAVMILIAMVVFGVIIRMRRRLRLGISGRRKKLTKVDYERAQEGTTHTSPVTHRQNTHRGRARLFCKQNKSINNKT